VGRNGNHLTMNLVAADVSPLHLIQSDVRADSRRLLRFRDSRRDKSFGKISPRPSLPAGREEEREKYGGGVKLRPFLPAPGVRSGA
jgi:hypothetical protein